MTWDIFTKAIKEVDLENGTQVQILISLFKSAGYIVTKDEGISESAAKKWIDGTRNCKASIYFPDNKLGNPEGAYKFFRRRPDGKLRKLQQIFGKEKDDDSPIDCETEDMDRFCWSLVNQFLDILGFQRIDVPTSDMSPVLEALPDTVENENSKNAVMEQRSITFQSGNIYQKETKCQTTGAQIAVPQYCRICLCCKYWKGDAEATYKNMDDEYGECKALGKRVLSTDGCDCDKFKENYNQIMKYQFYKKNKYLFSRLPDIKWR